jgi:FkbM family methyltransferase
MIKRTIKRILQFIVPPELFLDILILYRKSKENEMAILSSLCDKSKISIDVGASDGLYLAPMRKYSKHCIAFEPRSVAKKELDYLFRKCMNVTIEEVALSNYTGVAKLQIFKDDEGRSTIEKENDLTSEGSVEIVDVPVLKLDDYIFQEGVGFIKIDVEGHEENVLQGALSMLNKFHPNILIEIEERHNKGSFNRVQFLLHAEGYKGFVYLDHKLKSIDNADISNLQNIKLFGTSDYIYNFIFIHKINLNKFSHLIKI